MINENFKIFLSKCYKRSPRTYIYKREFEISIWSDVGCGLMFVGTNFNTIFDPETGKIKCALETMTTEETIMAVKAQKIIFKIMRGEYE